MLKESRFARYLLYVIGEIVLVVIGILIALQINNWNEGRKVSSGVDDQMRSMIKELQQDVEFYQDLIEHDRKRIGFLRSLSNRTFDTLALAMAPGLISFNYDQRRFGTAYQALKQSGRLNLIDNPELRETMIDYFEGTCVDFNNRSDWHKDFVTTNVEPFIMKHLPVNSSVETDPDAVLRELTGTELKNIVSIQLWNHKRTDSHAEKAMASAAVLIEMIAEELDGQ